MGWKPDISYIINLYNEFSSINRFRPSDQLKIIKLRLDCLFAANTSISNVLWIRTYMEEYWIGNKYKKF